MRLGHRLARWIVALLVAGGAYLGVDEWRYRAERDDVFRELARGRTSAVLPRLDRLAGWRPRDGEVLYQLGQVEGQAGRVDRAVGAWARVPTGSAFAGRAAMERARVALVRHRLAEAEGLLAVAARDKGAHVVEASGTLLHLLKIEGRNVEALRLVRAAGVDYPDPIGALKEMAQIESIRPYPLEKARLALERASEATPDDDRVWLGRANLATREGRFDEARAWLDRAERARPGDVPVARGRLALALAAVDEPAARRVLRALPAGELDPKEVLSLRAWFGARSGDEAREQTALADLVGFDRANLIGLERLAELELKAGRADEAARLRARKAALDRSRALYQIYLFEMDAPPHAADMAILAEDLDRPLEAEMLWRLALKRHPDDGKARDGLARVAALPPRPPPPRASLAGLLAEIGPARPAGPPKSAVAGAEPRFVDDAYAVGLDFRFDNGVDPLRHLPETMSGGLALLDYDGDGWLDVYCVQGGPFPPHPDRPGTGDRLFHNRGNGTFEDATERSGIARMPRGYGHGVTVGDYDNDGRPDLFVTRWRSYALYHNKGDGTFEDATAPAGLGGDRDWPTSAAFADLDGDGDLDLYVCHYLVWDADHPSPCFDAKKQAYAYCGPPKFPSRPDHAFRNDGGRFVDVTAESGLKDTHGQGLGVVAADLDDDGKVDLFVANDQTANFLFRNLGGFRFEEVGESSGVGASADGTYQASMGVDLGDPDGDGRPDILVTNFYNEGTTLYRNLGGLAFADHTAATGLLVATRYMLGFGVAFLDFNADGRLDIASANGHVDDFRPDEPYMMPAQLLAGSSGGKFLDLSKRAGAPWQVPRLGRGLARGDLDNDGRDDLLILAQNGPLSYFHNTTEGGGHWLTLLLEGTASNRDAVGARVRVKAGGKVQHRWRIGGGSYQSAPGPRLHFGLGDATEAETVEVSWPSGRVDRLGPLKADAAYRLREGEPAPRPLGGFGALRSP